MSLENVGEIKNVLDNNYCKVKKVMVVHVQKENVKVDIAIASLKIKNVILVAHVLIVVIKKYKFLEKHNSRL